MRNKKLTLQYEDYIAAPAKKVWEALTDSSTTKHCFYGCSVQSTFKKGAQISYLGDGEFNILDGEVLEVKSGENLVTTFQARWNEQVSKDKPSRELMPTGQSSKLTLVHDQFDSKTATWKQSANGWNIVLSSLRAFLETGKPLLLNQSS